MNQTNNNASKQRTIFVSVENCMFQYYFKSISNRVYSMNLIIIFLHINLEKLISYKESFQHFLQQLPVCSGGCFYNLFE